MPVQRGKDSKGPFYRWGNSGAKYHYKSGSERSREIARVKASRQGRAIKMRQGKTKYKREMRPGSAEEDEFLDGLMKKYGKQKK